MPRIIHFEITADKPERASQFYSEVFGWAINKWNGPEDYWLVSTGEKDKPGIDGALMRKGNLQQNIINTIDVPSVDEFTKKVELNGGKVITPKTSIPGVGFFAYCKDTEDNIFGIMQEDNTAK